MHLALRHCAWVPNGWAGYLLYPINCGLWVLRLIGVSSISPTLGPYLVKIATMVMQDFLYMFFCLYVCMFVGFVCFVLFCVMVFFCVFVLICVLEKERNDPDVDDDVEDVKMTTMVESPTKSPSKKIRSVPFYKKLIYFYDSPATKFVMFSIFYLIFLMILCYHSVLKKNNEWRLMRWRRC